jgi:anthranilate phosphoribosyltransferase
MIDFAQAIAQVRAGHNLTSAEITHLVTQLLEGSISQDEEMLVAVGEFLVALRQKGETADELVGAARAMRAHMTPIGRPADMRVLLDTCGTGGSGTGTFNISTATAIVVAAAGIPVAKHGNRRATSSTGSADVLSELGVQIESEREVVERSLAEVNLCFCFAPKLHPAMRYVAAVRRSIPTATMFNFLGPLCNPAGATHQLLGAGRDEIQSVLAEAAGQLGTTRSVVVRGVDGQDEVSLAGPTKGIEVLASGELLTHAWEPEMFGLPSCRVSDLVVANPKESAAVIRGIFAGEPGPCRNTVLANAAVAFWLVGKTKSLLKGAQMAGEIIDQGAAANQLQRLIRATEKRA